MHLPTGSDATYSGRHKDLQPLLPALARFIAAFNFQPDLYGKAANDNGKVSAVLDRRVDTVAAYCKSILAAAFHEKGLKMARATHRKIEVLNKGGEAVVRSYPVQRFTITHVWGRSTDEENGRLRVARDDKSVKAAAATLEWFCTELRAIPPSRPKKLFGQRKQLPPIDWTEFQHVRGAVPLEDARAACDLPPSKPIPAGLPHAPRPQEMFLGLVTGRGSRSDGSGEPSVVRRPDPDSFTEEDAILEHKLINEFRAAEPKHYRTLTQSVSAGSMGDLVASNDNGTGKRTFRRAAEAWRDFCAA